MLLRGVAPLITTGSVPAITLVTTVRATADTMIIFVKKLDLADSLHSDRQYCEHEASAEG